MKVLVGDVCNYTSIAVSVALFAVSGVRLPDEG
jgi:hypothetical protein